MVQSIIIGLLLLGSLIYLGRIFYRSFKGNPTCETGCGKCGDIEKSLEGLSEKK